jgi:PAS domain S-box-containing protein
MFLFISVLFIPPDACAAANPKKRVLVLNSYNKGLSWTDGIVRGVESEFQQEAGKIEISFEYMDTKRSASEKYFKLLYGTYRIKYEKERFDVIIACDNDAFNFVSKYRKTLFPGVPVVFCGINNFTNSMVWDPAQVTGVVEETDIRSTLEVALKLFPKTRQIVVIDDKTTTGVAVKQELLNIAPQFMDRVKFEFLEDFDVTELKQQVRAIQPNSIILLLVVNRDRTGNFFAYEESLAFIYNETRYPIFSIWDFYLGGGIVGGMLTSGYSQGKTAAGLALRIVKGESVSNVPVVRKSPNRFMFDYYELQRFGIRSNQLPQESVLINQPDTFYGRYKAVILWIIGIISFLSVVIFILLANISERKKVEKALRESEEKYRDLYDNAPDMYHSVDIDGIIIDCNETEAVRLGYKKEELIGRPITDFWTETSRKLYEKDFSALTRGEKEQVIEREFVCRDGSAFFASLHVYANFDEKGNFIKTKTIARDITESKNLENKLKHSREELRNLYAHVQSVREEERRFIASEIHDELGQELTTLKLDLSWLKTKLVKENNQLAEKIPSMKELVDRTIESVQRISSELRPGVLDHLGLPDAIEWLAGEVCSRKGLNCNITIDPEDIVLDQDLSIAIFRIFQEALTNIVRHAEAAKVEITLTRRIFDLMLTVKDNGIGIPDDKLKNRKSFGLIGIRERARYFGGVAKITGCPGGGTNVEVIIPLANQEAKNV